MKCFFSVLFASVAFLLVLPVQAPGSAPGAPRILRTDIYPGNAKITFSVPFEQGLSFELPGTFDAESIRPLPSDGQSVHSFEALEFPRPGWIPLSLREADKTIREKERALAVLEGKTAAVKQSIQILSGPLPKDLKGEDIPAYVEATRSVREKLESDLITLTESMDKMKKEIEALQEDFAVKMPRNSDLGVSVKARVTGKGELLVEAWTSYADWTPFYRMDLDSDSGTISASLISKARQHTGVPLDGDLYFHTVMPSREVSMPKLRPLVADFERKAVKGYEALEEAAIMMERPAFRMASAPEAPAPVIIETMTDMTAHAQGLLEGNNTWSEFGLGEFSMKAESAIVSIPLFSDEAWITAEAKEIPQPILPGTAELSTDGQLSAKVHLSEQGAGTDLSLAFGKLPLVKAKREKIVSKTGSSWTGKGRLEDGYTIEIVNGTKKKITVLLKDRIPLSAQEKISVETISIEPEVEEQDKENILTWKFALEPGEKKNVKVLYRLGYPADETIRMR